MEKTLALIKPDAVSASNAGEILSILEENFSISGLKMFRFTRATAERFYFMHKGKPFFEKLISFMCSGKSIALILEGEDAVRRYRELLGNTNPSEASKGTIREKFGSNNTKNACHGSDSQESAERETSFFFSGLEV